MELGLRLGDCGGVVRVKTHGFDSNGRTIWIAHAHRGDGKRFVVRADEKLTAFLELEKGGLYPLVD